MISIGSKATYGYDPRTGKERWRLEERGAHSGSTRPVPGHGLIFYPTGFPTGQLLAIRLPANGGDAHARRRLESDARRAQQALGPARRRSDFHGQRRRHSELRRRERRAPSVWTSRLAGTYSASPVAAAGRVYFCQRRRQDDGDRGGAGVQDARRESARRRHSWRRRRWRATRSSCGRERTSIGLKRARRRSYNLQSFTSSRNSTECGCGSP